MRHIFIVAVTLIGLTDAAKEWNPVEVDFIVVGAGAAGSAVASRLSEGGKYQVALIEAGGEPNYVSQVPYRAFENIGSEYDWQYFSEKQKNSYLAYKDKTYPITRGKGLGGTTILAGLVYTRGNRKDYDHWASLGNDEWDYESVLPFFKKLEDYQASLVNDEDKKYHNKNGPVTVSDPLYVTEFREVFHKAAEEIGLPAIDYNAGTQYGVTRPMFTIRNGTRHTPYDAYLKTARERTNLHIIINALVTKIIFEKRTAIGVVFEKNDLTYILKSSKETIISGGTINSPQLLMLSGVGPRETLEKYNIPLVADLPGVGQNLQDHPSTIGSFFTIDDPNFGFKTNEVNENTMRIWEQERKGPLTNPIRVEGLMFFNSKYNTEGNDFPDLEMLAIQPPGIKLDLPSEVAQELFETKNKNIVTLCPILLRPKSKGFITLRSSDPHVYPLIEPNIFSEPEDIKPLIEGVKMALKIVNTEAFKKHGVVYHGKKFSGCQELEENTDEYWECMVKHYTIVHFHSVGTCKMGPDSDDMAVVDPQLRVHKVKGLRVADASIMPRIVSGHPIAPVIMIGEKAADMILKDHRKKHEEL